MDLDVPRNEFEALQMVGLLVLVATLLQLYLADRWDRQRWPMGILSSSSTDTYVPSVPLLPPVVAEGKGIHKGKGKSKDAGRVDDCPNAKGKGKKDQDKGKGSGKGGDGDGDAKKRRRS